MEYIGACSRVGRSDCGMRRRTANFFGVIARTGAALRRVPPQVAGVRSLCLAQATSRFCDAECVAPRVATQSSTSPVARAFGVLRLHVTVLLAGCCRRTPNVGCRRPRRIATAIVGRRAGGGRLAPARRQQHCKGCYGRAPRRSGTPSLGFLPSYVGRSCRRCAQRSFRSLPSCAY